MPAVVAADAGEALPEVATFEKLADGQADDWPPKAVFRLVALGIDLLELGVDTSKITVPVQLSPLL